MHFHGVADGHVLRAARTAHAHEFIGQWKDGYDTVIGDRGLRLSGGQEPAQHDPVGMISSKDVMNLFGGELVYYRRLGSTVDHDELTLRFRP